MSTQVPVSRVPRDRLRRIETVTDAALAHLGVEDLLDELLSRVRELLSADTAAVLLLDASGRFLVATAACGIEEEVRQDVRIPLGEGFAGRIAAQKQAVALEQVDHANVLNPILREKGIRSLLGVPLLAGGSVIGVLHVGTLRTRRFTDEDRELLQLVGDRVALATQARIAQVERTSATTLQRSLLPAGLPVVPGLEIATRYAPGGGGEVGGDWYDVFDLPSGHLCVVVGDVVGRGLPAAVTMGRIRSALRAYALQVADPGELLRRLDAQLRHFEPDVMATVLCAIVEPDHERLLVSSAGHTPPVAARPDGPGELVTLPADLPLGVDSTRERHTTILPLPPGHGLFIYTDGLVERPGVALDAGFALLCDAVRAGPAESVCIRAMSELVGSRPVLDDIAILMLSRREQRPGDPLQLQVRAIPTALAGIRGAIRRWAAGAGADAEEVNDIVIAVGEACSNAVEHAYGPAGGIVSVHLALDPPAVVAVIDDHGRWRAPRGRNRGRGTALMRGLADDVAIEHRPGGTRVTIRKNLATGGRG